MTIGRYARVKGISGGEATTSVSSEYPPFTEATRAVHIEADGVDLSLAQWDQLVKETNELLGLTEGSKDPAAGGS